MKLENAIVMGDVAAVKVAAGKKPSPARLGNGLVTACSLGNSEIVHVLLDLGADPNWELQGHPGGCPLHHAVWLADPTVIVGMLLDRGADPNRVRPDRADGRSPLFMCRSPSAIRMLVAAGARTDVRDHEGLTPLISSIAVYDDACVHALMDAGASPDYPDRYGNTPLAYALMLQGGDDARVQSLTRIRQELVRKGASGGEQAASRAVIAARDGDVETLAKLLASGHSPDIAGPFGARPLILAAAGGHTAVVKQLLSAGADADQQDRGLTALMAAARGNMALPGSGNLHIAKLLVDAGADLSIVQNPAAEGDLDALWYAKEFRNKDIVAYLRDAQSQRGAESPYVTKRGIGNNEIAQRMVLLEAGIDDVSRELASWLGAAVTQDVLEKEMQIGTVSLQVGQFRRHRWTFINPLAGGASIALDTMSAELAQRLRCRALFYASDEAHTVLRYRFHDAAGTEESFDYCKPEIVAQQLRTMPKDSPHRKLFEQIKAGKGVRLESRLRQVRKIKEPLKFAHEFISRLGVFIPPFTPDTLSGGETIQLNYPEIEPRDLVRMDLVTK